MIITIQVLPFVISKVDLQSWAPAGIDKRGHLTPLEMLLFCALSVTVKRLVDQSFMRYFHNFLEGGSSVVHLVVLACFRATTKKVLNF